MSDVFEGYEKYVRPTMQAPVKPEPATFDFPEEENNAGTPNAEPREAKPQITEEMKAALFEEFKKMMASENAAPPEGENNGN